MRYSVHYQGDSIGNSDLEGADPDMGVAFGQFQPTPRYERVRHIFRMFAEAHSGAATDPLDERMVSEYYSERDRLGLTLVDQSGRIIQTMAIHVADFSVEFGEDAYQLEVITSDEKFWESRSAADKG
jgi:hypothetical protein